ncbi:MAG: EamA family transporter [Spirochaetaceae bacterium]
MIPSILAFASALSFGAADFAGGLASRRAPSGAVVLYSQILGLFLALALAPVVGSAAVGTKDVLFGALAGIAGAFGLFFLYRGLATGLVAVVSPTAAMVGTVVPLVFGLLAGERLLPTDRIGIALALPAILLLSWEPPGEDGSRGEIGRSLAVGTLAGLGFGLFFILIAETSETSGLWPLAAARVGSISLLFALALLRSSLPKVPREAWISVAAAGALDMAANVLFLLAARSGLLTISVVIASLYPGPTVILAALYFRERLRPFRISGLLLAVGSVAFMSL